MRGLRLLAATGQAGIVVPHEIQNASEPRNIISCRNYLLFLCIATSADVPTTFNIILSQMTIGL